MSIAPTDWQVRAQLSFATNSVQVYAFTHGMVDPGVQLVPTYHLTQTAAQRLMDDLYDSGFRPTQAAVTDATLSAKSDHLKELSGLLQQVLPVALRKPSG